MKQQFTIIGLTILFVVLIDCALAITLHKFERYGQYPEFRRYFTYGLSVPNKLAIWEKKRHVWDQTAREESWREKALQISHEKFLSEPTDNGPVIRSYGMSFLDDIMNAAIKERPEFILPDINLDLHSGPGAPPNYAYAIFEADRANRREGDVVVLGILTSSLPLMASMSNRTWSYEQPIPYTYPIYQPEGEKLKAIEPLVNDMADQELVASNKSAHKAWYNQLAREDKFYTPVAFALPQLDASPLVRLLRRWFVTSRVKQIKTKILNGQVYPFETVFQRMIIEFSRTAKADGQIPIVVLIQPTRFDIDPLSLIGQTLAENNILYFTIADHINLLDNDIHVEDGHFQPHINKTLGDNFLAFLMREL